MPEPETRPSSGMTLRQARFWKITRRAVQAAAFIGFIALFLLARRGAADPAVANLAVRISPLAMLAQIISSRSFLAGSAVALILVLMALAVGRAWCGWLCPLGTLLDWFSFRRKKPAAEPPEALRAGKYLILTAILTGALLGNLTLLVLDPLTIFFRSLTVSLLPALDWMVTGLEKWLYPVRFLSKSIAAFDSWVRPAILPTAPAVTRSALVPALFLIAILALNTVAQRFWCRYLCPLGGLLGLLSRISIFRRKVLPACVSCARCDKACPTGAIHSNQQFASDPAECTLCMDCFAECPAAALCVRAAAKPAPRQEFDPSRRQALGAIGAGLLGVALVKAEQNDKTAHPFLLRPPGAEEEHFLSACIRCGVCLRACPTGALQPAVDEAGVEGFWTPILLPRSGYCEFSCNACGQICPVQAIPPLALEEKQVTVIGKAYINQNRCIAWADHRNCIVCEEMCPLPDKAITLTETEAIDAAGQTVLVKLPQVNRERCIGCGICEHKCPLQGEAAIRVYNGDSSFIYG